MKLLLVDLSSVFFPIYHMSGKEPDVDHSSRATVARVHQAAIGYDGVAICCDSPRSVRKEMDPTYKANRPAHEAPLLHQLKLAREQLGADGFPCWTVDGYEADDVIASAIAQLVQPEIPAGHFFVDVLSADKDLLALADDKVTVVSPGTGRRYGPVETAEKFVRPIQMRDFLILVGDASDNVKGVKGVGEVKAKALLDTFGSIVGIYKRLNEGPPYTAPLTPAIVASFQDGLVAIENARKLVTLHDELPIPLEEILKPRIAAQETDMPTDPDTGEVTEPHDTDPPRPASDPPPKPAETAMVLPGVLDAKPDDDAKALPAQLVKVEWNRELEPRNMRQVQWLAQQMFKSRLFAAYGTEQAVLATVLAGRELGIGAMASLRGFHIIEGKPSMSSGLMSALVLQSGKAKYFACTKTSSETATFKTWRVGDPEPVEVTFTIDDAKRAQLTGKGNWSKYPADMLVSRAIARLARLVYSDVVFGLYTADELGRDDLELESEAA